MAAKAGTETKKKTSAQRQKEEEKRARIEELTAKKVSLENRISTVAALRGGFEMPQLEGREVEHTLYGPGTIIKHKGAVITVRYGDEEKKQKLPLVVAGHLMSLGDEELETRFEHMAELDKQRDAMEKELQYVNSQLGDLEKM